MANIFTVLSDLNLPYTRYDHPAVFTCEEADVHCKDIPGGTCKNLFFRGKKTGKYFLVVLDKNKRADIKKLESLLGERVTFASSEEMQIYLGVTPGAVTMLGLIHDTNRAVSLIIDADLWKNDELQMHPLTNTATVVMKRADIQRFFDALGFEPRFAEL